MLIGWNGDDNHPELSMLYNAIGNILHPENKATLVNDNGQAHHNKKFWAGLQPILRYLVIGAGLLVIVLGAIFFLPKNPDKMVTIRVFDWKKKPITQGSIKIYLNEYIRTASIDNMGQALFTGIPAAAATHKMKIEVSSPGYATKNYDTLVDNKPLELVLPLTAVIMISGKVKTAAEMPIKGVEIGVDGTRYYAVSITDGTYNLRLEEYTLGDEITITTSHPDYEDKTISLRINSPDITNEDIFLNPVKHLPVKHKGL